MGLRPFLCLLSQYQWENLGEDKAKGAIVQCFEDHKRP